VEKRAWDKLGISTSLIGFGCMRFPVLKDGSIDRKTAEKMLDLAYEAGVNYYDTAYMYHDGESERFLGEWVKKHDRKSLYVATKLPVMMIDSLEQAKQIFKEQQEKMQMEQFDFYLLHALNWDRYKKAKEQGIVAYCERLKKEGKIKYFGFSFHDSFEAFEKILMDRDWDFCQIQLNYMDTQEQAGLKGYELAKEMGVPMVVMEPVKGGSLATLPNEIADLFYEVHKELSLSSWAYRFIGSLNNVKVVLSGMSAIEHVKDNIHTFSPFIPLSREEEQTIEHVKQAIKKRVNNGCTACRYCMPCPAGVNIPKNFSIWNRFGMYHNVSEIEWAWSNIITDSEKAKNCIRCGKCEQACPQKLHIRDNLAQLEKELDNITC